MKEFSYGELEAATKGFSLDRLVGKGSHGSVYRAVLKGGKRVAVKKPSLGLHSRLDHEINILASLRGPQLVNLLGVSHGSAHKLLVMELMPNGSLQDLLHSPSPSPTLSWARRAAVALDVARAVRSLHEVAPPVVHRDVKPANVLLDGRWRARLADFSLAARACSDGDGSLPPDPAGTMGYLDPSYTAPERLGPANDVYSFGVVLLELVSARRPVDVERDPASVVAWAVPMIESGRLAEVCDRRVALPRGGAERLVACMLRTAARCVSSDEESRPSMADVVAELEGVMSQVWLSENKFGRTLFIFINAWRKWRKNKVTTTRIVCKDHLVDDDDDDLS